MEVVLNVVADRAIATLNAFSKQVEVGGAAFDKFAKNVTVQSQLASMAFLKGFQLVSDWLYGVSPTFKSFFDVINVSFTDLGETISSDLEPAFSLIAETIQGLVDAYNNLDPSIRTVLSAIIGLAAALGLVSAAFTLLAPIMTSAMGILGLFAPIVEVVGVLMSLLAVGLGTTLLGAFVAVAAALAVLWLAWQTNFGNIQGFVTDVIKILGDLFDGLVTTVRGVFDVIIGIFTLSPDKIMAGVDEIISGLAGIGTACADLIVRIAQFGLDLLAGFAGIFSSIITSAWNFGTGLVTSIVDGINSVASQIGSAIWNAIPSEIRGLLQSGMGIASGVASGIGGLLHLAGGGIVTSPTLALIGESGPEAVVPLSGGNAGVGGGVTVQNLNIYNPQMRNDMEISDQVRKIVQELHLQTSAASGAFGTMR